MAELVRVVVDAMGGDNAPAEPVRGAVEAVKARKDIQVLLTGQKDVIEKEMAKYPDCPKEQIEIVHASEVIETAEPPVFAIRKKKDSSIVVGLNMIKNRRQMHLYHPEAQEQFLWEDRSLWEEAKAWSGRPLPL